MTLLIRQVGEACVCDLITAIRLDQPKVSRCLRDLRRCGVLADERRGKWVFYRLHPSLPDWAAAVLNAAGAAQQDTLHESMQSLTAVQAAAGRCC
ncbi:metalloregulator ArsR/SmtB family transcription factor [Alteromonas sp. CYL-A6]|uniref:metalloregulator ArsR/SmtB family transcription factor n=1 Tax=Alteromonas nitratireducens TaxID=3390813 RepID=UPI00398386A8